MHGLRTKIILRLGTPHHGELKGSRARHYKGWKPLLYINTFQHLSLSGSATLNNHGLWIMHLTWKETSWISWYRAKLSSCAINVWFTYLLTYLLVKWQKYSTCHRFQLQYYAESICHWHGGKDTSKFSTAKTHRLMKVRILLKTVLVQYLIPSCKYESHWTLSSTGIDMSKTFPSIKCNTWRCRDGLRI